MKTARMNSCNIKYVCGSCGEAAEEQWSVQVGEAAAAEAAGVQHTLTNFEKRRISMAEAREATDHGQMH